MSYLKRDDVISLAQDFGQKFLAEDGPNKYRYLNFVTKLCSLPAHKMPAKTDEYIDGYADAMQEMEKFLEKNLKFREEVGSEKS